MAPSLEDPIVLPEAYSKILLKPSKQFQALSYSDDIVLQKTNHWEHVIQEIPTRCDLNNLLRDGQKHQADLRKPYETKEQCHISARLSVGLEQKLNDFSSCKELQIGSILQFAWHKVFNVYGNGDKTVLATALPETGGDSQLPLALPVAVNHADQHRKSCIDCIETIDLQTQQMIIQQDFIDSSRVNTGIFDSSFTLRSLGTCRNLQRFFPINCIVHDDTGLPSKVTIIYAGELFEEELITGLVDVFLVILDQLLSAPSLPVAELLLLNDAQSRELDAVNDTDGDYPSSKRLNELFEETASNTPRNVAVRYKERQLTYEELNAGANRLAHYLASTEGANVQPEQLVALFLDKSELMVLVVLAIWKSGACYSPIEPTYPDARIRFSLEDTGARIIIANRSHLSRLSQFQDQRNRILIIQVESLLERLAEDGCFPSSNPQFSLNSQQLAYVTYTSGTTGVPKGIQKRHTNVVNSITDLAERYGVKNGHDVVVLFSPYVFEPFARQTLMALLNSHVLVVVDDDIKLDPVIFPNILKQYNVTYLNGTASVLQEYDYSDCPDLKKLVLVGEDLTEVRYNALRRKFKHLIINEYG
jgi:N-(5-amino-5-carboxypentanoyl)-L-cysteinyl-D-valine synthase